MIEPGEEINTVFWLIVSLVSIVPFYVFFLGYRRVRSRKILMITVAFSLFIVKGFLLSMKLFLPNADEGGWFLDDEFWWTIAAVLDVFIVCLFSIALGIQDSNSDQPTDDPK